MVVLRSYTVTMEESSDHPTSRDSNDGETSAPRVHSQIQLLGCTSAGQGVSCTGVYTKKNRSSFRKKEEDGGKKRPMSKQQQEDRRTRRAAIVSASMTGKRGQRSTTEKVVLGNERIKKERERELLEKQEELQTINMLIKLILRCFKNPSMLF